MKVISWRRCVEILLSMAIGALIFFYAMHPTMTVSISEAPEEPKESAETSPGGRPLCQGVDTSCYSNHKWDITCAVGNVTIYEGLGTDFKNDGGQWHWDDVATKRRVYSNAACIAVYHDN